MAATLRVLPAVMETTALLTASKENNMKQIAAALVKAQKEFGPALKTSLNPHFRNKYADLSACIEAVIDGLNNNGIYLMQLNEERENGICIQTVFIHESGEQITSGSLYVPAAKQDPQGFGSALTYARRYSLMTACGIAPEDDDANSAKAPAPRSEVAPEKKATPAILTKAEPKAPAKIEGTDSKFQIKVTATPETPFEDWLKVVADATIFALDATKNADDVMTIFRTNRVIYDKVQADSPEAYAELMETFKTYKESFNGK